MADPEDDAELRSILAGINQLNKEDAEKRKTAANRSIINGIVGELEVPSGNNPFQNAWLTLTLSYDFRFLDSFVRHFQQGEAIWNHKFLIVPPPDFDLLDYISSAFPGYLMRPNILCLFRMISGGANAKTFNVVRLNPSVFED